MMNSTPRAILIAGPTASGKSALALSLAERCQGTIINADSMQIYQDLRILSARPSPEDEARTPHLLYGHIGAETAYSVGHYAQEVRGALDEVQAANRVPIIVGGTGLYFKALLEGLSPVPEIDPEIRSKWRAAGNSAEPGALHATLARVDAEMAARLKPGDRQRIVRALEVMEHTGRSLAYWQVQPGTPVLPDSEKIAKLVVAPPRDVLHRRADDRFEAMMSAGAVEEVRALTARTLDPRALVLRALGVAPISDWLSGEIDRDQAVARGQAETRQYIKRQTTWLRKNMMSWKWLSAQQMESQMDEILMFIDF